MHRPLDTILGSTVIVAVLLGVVLVAAEAPAWNKETTHVQLPADRPPVASSTPPLHYSDLSLRADSAIVIDAVTGDVLFTKSPDAQLPLASLTKLMTAYVADRTIPANSPVTVSRDAIAVSGNNGLLVQERWPAHALLDFTLVASSNDGAHALAAAAGQSLNTARSSSTSIEPFVNAMNRTASELGLRQTYFLNPTGLDMSHELSGSYGSARDVAKLLRAIVQSDASLISATQDPFQHIASFHRIHTATNTNSTVGDIPGLIGGKTGYTDLAGGNLATVFDVGLGHPVIAVVLHSSRAGRFEDMQQLVRATYTLVNEQSNE